MWPQGCGTEMMLAYQRNWKSPLDTGRFGLFANCSSPRLPFQHRLVPNGSAARFPQAPGISQTALLIEPTSACTILSVFFHDP